MTNKPFSIIERIKSFKHAIGGLKLFFITEHNGRIHGVAAVLAIALSFYLHLSGMEWIAILGAIAAVLVAEMLNTSIEKLADAVEPNYNPQIKLVKDVAASAVLIAAILALLIGGIVFIPKLF